MADKSNWKNKNRTITNFFERAGGTAEGKPHSTREGRIASGERKITRFFYGRDKKNKKGVPV